MRVRGWGRDLNRVQKERVVRMPRVDVVQQRSGQDEIRLTWCSIESLVDETSAFLPIEKLSMVGTLDELEELYQTLGRTLRAAGRNTS